VIFRTLTDLEIANKEFILEYDIVDDKYTRESNNNEIIKFWQKGVSEYSQIIRKEELDWKMVYLAREGKHFDPTILFNQMDYLYSL